MKKALLLVAVLVLLPAIAQATVTCNPGNYTGKLWSVLPDLNGKTGILTVKKEIGDKCVMNFKTEGDNEEWTLSGNTLLQKEFNNTNKVAQQYGATLQGDKYVINCKDAARKDCDAGVDGRNYWLIKATPSEVTYTVFGVPRDKKNDPSIAVAKRHEFTFKLEQPK